MNKIKIEGRRGIEKMVNYFYEQVRKDEKLGPIFDHQAQVNWQTHLPKMVDFWESVLTGRPTYSGNPILVHETLHQKFQLTKEDFEKWKELFLDNIDQHFEGELAETAKQRAVSIATVMQIKVLH